MYFLHVYDFYNWKVNFDIGSAKNDTPPPVGENFFFIYINKHNLLIGNIYHEKHFENNLKWNEIDITV